MLFVLYASCGDADESVADDKEDSGENALRAGETLAITNFVASMSAKDIEVKWGLYNVPELGDRVKVTILASGFETTTTPKREESAPGNTVGTNNPRVNGTIDILGQDKEIALRLAGYNILPPDDYDNDESIGKFISESPRIGYAGIIGKGNGSKGNGGNTSAPHRDNATPSQTNTISFEGM